MAKRKKIEAVKATAIRAWAVPNHNGMVPLANGKPNTMEIYLIRPKVNQWQRVLPIRLVAESDYRRLLKNQRGTK